MQLNQRRIERLEVGATIVELMIGLTLGLMITASALAMLASTTSGASSALGSARLNIELRGGMDVMVEDIRRAGFGLSGCDPNLATDIAVYDFDEDGIDDCVVYAYDSNNDGSCNFYGYRMEGGAISSRDGGSGDASDCANGSWESLTDPGTVVIDAPENNQSYFAISYQCIRANDISGTTTVSPTSEACKPGEALYDETLAAALTAGTHVGLIEVREVTIRLAGYLSSDAAMTMLLTQSVAVRNHRAVIVPSP